METNLRSNVKLRRAPGLGLPACHLIIVKQRRCTWCVLRRVYSQRVKHPSLVASSRSASFSSQALVEHSQRQGRAGSSPFAAAPTLAIICSRFSPDVKIASAVSMLLSFFQTLKKEFSTAYGGLDGEKAELFQESQVILRVAKKRSVLGKLT